MYPDYSYYTAITFVPTCMIPLYLVTIALLRNNVIDYFIFHFFWENGVWEKGFLKGTAAYHVFMFLLFWGYYHVRYTFRLAYYLAGYSNDRAMSKLLDILLNLHIILISAKIIFLLYLFLIYIASFFYWDWTN